MTLVPAATSRRRMRAATRAIAIVNEAMVRRYFKDRNPIGERFGEDKPRHRNRRRRPRCARQLGARGRDADGVLSVRSRRRRMSARCTCAPAPTPRPRRRGAQGPAGDRAQPAGRSHRARSAMLAAATLRQERLIARLTTVLGAARAGAGVPGSLWIDVVRGQAADRGARRPLRARRAAPARAVDGVPRIADADGRRDSRSACRSWSPPRG